MLENLKKLVAINSYENDNIIDFLEKEFKPNVEEVLVVKNKQNNKRNLIVGINTKLNNVEPIVLSGHIDTVAPDFEKYETNPFDLTVVADKAYGLGSIDMKSFTAVILDNIQKLKSLSCPHGCCLIVRWRNWIVGCWKYCFNI